MPRLITAILARNEAGTDRYWRRVLSRCLEFSDLVVVLDDGSTDATASIAHLSGAMVRMRGITPPAWGNEAPARAQLWELAVQQCGVGDWVVVCDADMLLHGDPRPLMDSREVAAWAWPLYDVWDSEETYRSDQFWQGHLHPRVWMVKPHSQGDGFVPAWPDRGIHCGHLPMNFAGLPAVAPPDRYWLHLGWQQAAHRRQKYEQYAHQAHLLTPFECAHMESILHE